MHHQDIWQDAIVVTDSGEMLQPADLIYSYFNGVYKRNGTHDGLPGEYNSVSGYVKSYGIANLL